jgi:hypothetical protein
MTGTAATAVSTLARHRHLTWCAAIRTSRSPASFLSHGSAGQGPSGLGVAGGPRRNRPDSSAISIQIESKRQ